MTTGTTAQRVRHDIRHDFRMAFRAFVMEGKHRVNGRFIGYEELGNAIGVGHSTVWRWMAQDFPEISCEISWGKRKDDIIRRATYDEDGATAAGVAPQGPASQRIGTRLSFWGLVKAGKHLKPDGKFMGYRELGEALGVSSSTVHRWMAADFPEIAANLEADPGAPAGVLEDGRHVDPAAVAAWRNARTPRPTYVEVAAHFGLNYHTARKYCVAAEAAGHDKAPVSPQAGR
ncbi:hypothetical protein [Azohydromonas caseinilytica]|uniref:Uncharacterized protein n=1 Tax=Azohydromonas caseinilytica TaxID=2728836 RepID=A0A848F7P4_9BURK|nr:hypothetical protein [Azohydromonas caseinilytica]NML15594.1 hypothetical protein [Azohydromonas caseinilytica]